MIGRFHSLTRRLEAAQLSAQPAHGLIVALMLAAAVANAQAPSNEAEVGSVAVQRPAILNGVDVEEHLDSPLPLDLTFRDDAGREIRLADYFGKDRPVILSMNYSRCPMLCNVQLTGLVDSLRRIPWSPGTEFEVVSVSIDPKETTAQAAKAKEKYVRAHGNVDAADGWHFLTGADGPIRKLASAIGFGYQYDARTNEYAHPAVFVIAAPDGRIVRYFYGKEFDPKLLRLSLAEASEGKVGSTIDRVLLFCYHFDPTSGAYNLVAMRVMQLGMGATALALALILPPIWLRERRRSRMRVAGAAAT